jgi:hypothetical protein
MTAVGSATAARILFGRIVFPIYKPCSLYSNTSNSSRINSSQFMTVISSCNLRLLCPAPQNVSRDAWIVLNKALQASKLFPDNVTGFRFTRQCSFTALPWATQQQCASFWHQKIDLLVKENRKGDRACHNWGVAYVQTNDLIGRLSQALGDRLTEMGFKSGLTPATHNFDEAKLMPCSFRNPVSALESIDKRKIN